MTSPTKQEVLDKIQALPLALDSSLPASKYKGKTYTQILFPAANNTAKAIQIPGAKHLATLIVGIVEVALNVLTLGIKPLVTNYFADRDIKNLVDLRNNLFWNDIIPSNHTDALKNLELEKSYKALIDLVAKDDEALTKLDPYISKLGYSEQKDVLIVDIKRAQYILKLEQSTEYLANVANARQGGLTDELIKEQALEIANDYPNLALPKIIADLRNLLSTQVTPSRSKDLISIIVDPTADMRTQLTQKTDELRKLLELKNNLEKKTPKLKNEIHELNIAKEEKLIEILEMKKPPKKGFNTGYFSSAISNILDEHNELEKLVETKNHEFNNHKNQLNVVKEQFDKLNKEIESLANEIEKLKKQHNKEIKSLSKKLKSENKLINSLQEESKAFLEVEEFEDSYEEEEFSIRRIPSTDSFFFPSPWETEY